MQPRSTVLSQCYPKSNFALTIRVLTKEKDRLWSGPLYFDGKYLPSQLTSVGIAGDSRLDAVREPEREDLPWSELLNDLVVLTLQLSVVVTVLQQQHRLT